MQQFVGRKGRNDGDHWLPDNDYLRFRRHQESCRPSWRRLAFAGRCSSRTLAYRTPALQPSVLSHLDPDHVSRYLPDTPPNPTEEAVRGGVTHYSDGGCDGVIALGGGSPIDLAKGVALAVTHEGPLRAICGYPWRRGQDHREGRAGDRYPDHCGNWQRGWPRRFAQPDQRLKAGVDQSLLDFRKGRSAILNSRWDFRRC